MAAELKAKGDVEASMMAAYINADEERLRKKEMEETMAEAKTKADKEDHKAAVHEEHKAPKGPIAAIHAEAGLISDVFAYRVFKKNPQWCVEWTSDGAVSWEAWEKLDSDQLRAKALELQKSVEV